MDKFKFVPAAAQPSRPNQRAQQISSNRPPHLPKRITQQRNSRPVQHAQPVTDTFRMEEEKTNVVRRTVSAPVLRDMDNRTRQLMSFYVLTGHPQVLEKWIQEGTLAANTQVRDLLQVGYQQQHRRLEYERYSWQDRTIGLWQACEKGDLYKATALIGTGIDLNLGDVEDGMTPLMRAAINNHTNIMEALLLAGANKDRPDRHLGETALFHAILLGNTRAAKFLITNGANVNTVNIFGTTPLMVAATFDRKELVKALLEAGAHTLPVNKHGETAFSKASKRGHDDIAEWIREASE